MKKNNELFGSLLVIIAGVLWGISGVFVRYFTGLGISSWTQTFFKVGFAGIALLCYCLIFDRQALKIKLKDLWTVLGSGLISLVFFTICYYSTIQATTMSVAATLLYLAPSMVMVMSAIFFKEKITKTKIASCIIAFIGCFFVAGLIGSGATLGAKAILTGILSAFGYATYSIFSQAAMNRGYSPITVTTYTFVFAAIGSAFFLHPAEISAGMAQAGTAKFVLLLMLMSVVVSLLPYISYTNGLKRTQPSKASIMASVEPITATVTGAVVFHELPDFWGYLGIACVIGAIVLLNVDAFRKKA